MVGAPVGVPVGLGERKILVLAAVKVGVAVVGTVTPALPGSALTSAAEKAPLLTEVCSDDVAAETYAAGLECVGTETCSWFVEKAKE